MNLPDLAQFIIILRYSVQYMSHEKPNLFLPFLHVLLEVRQVRSVSCMMCIMHQISLFNISLTIKINDALHALCVKHPRFFSFLYHSGLSGMSLFTTYYFPLQLRYLLRWRQYTAQHFLMDLYALVEAVFFCIISSYKQRCVSFRITHCLLGTCQSSLNNH